MDCEDPIIYGKDIAKTHSQQFESSPKTYFLLSLAWETLAPTGSPVHRVDNQSYSS